MATTVAGPQPAPRPADEEILAGFDNIPLFMKSLPDEATEDSSITALQSLLYEGTPDGG